MKRPYVNLNSKNLIDKKRAALLRTLDRFTGLGGVVGVLLNGGLSRGYADELSEIDVKIFQYFINCRAWTPSA